MSTMHPAPRDATYNVGPHVVHVTERGGPAGYEEYDVEAVLFPGTDQERREKFRFTVWDQARDWLEHFAQQERQRNAAEMQDRMETVDPHREALTRAQQEYHERRVGRIKEFTGKVLPDRPTPPDAPGPVGPGGRP